MWWRPRHDQISWRLRHGQSSWRLRHGVIPCLLAAVTLVALAAGLEPGIAKAQVPGIANTQEPGTTKTQQPGILIFRPLDNNEKVLVEGEDQLLVVPGGRMFMFQVEISAFAPVVEVRINGRVQRVPRNTFILLKQPQFLRYGMNSIVVEAFTRFARSRREFRIELKTLPGFSKHAAR
ncbi:MAG: hypothetical protein O7A69_11420 [SAR324 cluster bacterium]|nr:hypothetical protein [SAR324 cluster bacterium]